MNRTAAEVVNAKERNKAKKERVNLQHGKQPQGSKESDGDEEEEEEEDESNPNIPCCALVLEDVQTDAGQANLTLIPQHALAQTNEDVPPRLVKEDAP